MAVATKPEQYASLVDLIPYLVGHAIALLLGMVCIGLGLRLKKQTA